MSRFVRLLLVLSCAALSACGGSSGNNALCLPGDGGDGGLCIPVVPGGGSDAAVGGPLSVSLPLGLDIIEIPKMGEKPIQGSVFVTRGTATVADAVVTINGIAIPADPKAPGFYDTAAVATELQAVVKEGAELTVIATTTVPPETSTLTLRCPGPSAFSAPEATAKVFSGPPLHVAWSPALAHEGSKIGFFACFISDTHDQASIGGGANRTYTRNLAVGLSSFDLQVDVECERYLLELSVKGERAFVYPPGNLGYCEVHKRLMLDGVIPVQ